MFLFVSFGLCLLVTSCHRLFLCPFAITTQHHSSGTIKTSLKHIRLQSRAHVSVIRHRLMYLLEKVVNSSFCVSALFSILFIDDVFFLSSSVAHLYWLKKNLQLNQKYCVFFIDVYFSVKLLLVDYLTDYFDWCVSCFESCQCLFLAQTVDSK